MRIILGCLAALGLVSGAQSGTLWNERIAQWTIGAYSNEQTGNFNHCGAGVSYNSGVLLMFSVGASYSWSMGFANKNWRLKPGNEYSVRYWVDANEPIYAMAVATSAEQVEILLKDSVPLFNQFRRGYTLFVSAQNTDFQFNLTDSSRVLTYLLDCVNAAGHKPAISTASVTNPFASSPAAPPTGSRSSAAPGSQSVHQYSILQTRQ